MQIKDASNIPVARTAEQRHTGIARRTRSTGHAGEFHTTSSPGPVQLSQPPLPDELRRLQDPAGKRVKSQEEPTCPDSTAFYSPCLEITIPWPFFQNTYRRQVSTVALLHLCNISYTTCCC